MGILKETVKKLPVVAELVQERDKLFAELSAIGPNGPYKFFVPPGHFFSPLPELDYVKRHEAEIFGEVPRTIPGIDLREAEQLELLRQFQPYYAEMPFSPGRSENCRYCFENPAIRTPTVFFFTP